MLASDDDYETERCSLRDRHCGTEGVLRKVWDDKLVQPQLKIFASRLLHLALGTASRVNRIMPAVSAICL
jgi:hypothetical protein